MTWNDNGTMATRTDAANNNTTFNTDSLGHIAAIKSPTGYVWPNGDGEDLSGLGNDVAGIVANIVASRHPALIIIVTHSRGGLAARAFLQTNARSDVKFALLTIGTPHLGSPLARVTYFFKNDSMYRLNSSDWAYWEAHDSAMHFVFSPSTATLASDHDQQQGWSRTAISDNVGTLNLNVRYLGNSTTAFGQIIGTGYALGNATRQYGVAINVLDDSILPKLPAQAPLPGSWASLVAMRSFVLKNLQTTGAPTGTGSSRRPPPTSRGCPEPRSPCQRRR